ncbi:MAG: hypothetical protein P1V81_04040 [Planctomycetota bacterium]|nr:hypothetical protein [Planctomycetota bacterium]
MNSSLALLGLPLLLLFLGGDDRGIDDDLEHYLPGADRIAFETEVDWQVTQLGVRLDGVEFELGTGLEGLTGRTRWVRRVRDLEVATDPLILDRDYEDILLGTTFGEAGVPGLVDPAGDLEIFGGIERERLRFAAVDGGWGIQVPKRSPLDADGLVALRAGAHLSFSAPPAAPRARGARLAARPYDLPLAALDELLFPLGHPATLLAPKGWSKLSDRAIPEGGPVEDPEGSLRATWHPGDGGTGRIELVVEVSFGLDPLAALAAAGQAWMDGTELQAPMELGSARGGLAAFEVQLSGRGGLLFDLESGRFLSLDLPLAFETSFEGQVDWDLGGRTYAIEVFGQGQGEVRIEYDFRAAQQAQPAEAPGTED